MNDIFFHIILCICLFNQVRIKIPWGKRPFSAVPSWVLHRTVVLKSVSGGQLLRWPQRASPSGSHANVSSLPVLKRADRCRQKDTEEITICDFWDLVMKGSMALPCFLERPFTPGGACCHIIRILKQPYDRGLLSIAKGPVLEMDPPAPSQPRWLQP